MAFIQSKLEASKTYLECLEITTPFSMAFIPCWKYKYCGFEL